MGGLNASGNYLLGNAFNGTTSTAGTVGWLYSTYSVIPPKRLVCDRGVWSRFPGEPWKFNRIRSE